MKVIGVVNRFSRGIQRVQEELKTNGNEEADFNLALETAFLVKVNISKKSFASKDDTKEAKDEAKDETKDETIAKEGAKDDTKAKGKAKEETKDDTIDDTKDNKIAETKDDIKDDIKDVTIDDTKDDIKAKEKAKAKEEAKEDVKEKAKEETISVSEIEIAVYNLISTQPDATRKEISMKLGISDSKSYQVLSELKQKGFIKRDGGRKIGYWKILKDIYHD